MSKQFLEQILREENIVVFDTSQNCHICLQRLGELSSETGVIECGIRLPCDHVFGSACVATWLRSNNTCPMCRRVLFSPHPSPGQGTDTDDEVDDREEVVNMADLCINFALQLDLPFQVGDLACEMAELLWESDDWTEHHTERCTAAMSLYMSSHLLNQAKSVEEISGVSQMTAGHIRWSYRQIHTHRERYVPDSLLVELSMSKLDGFLTTLSSRTVRDEINEEVDWDENNDDYTNEEEFGIIFDRARLEDLCEQTCIELGFDGLVDDVAWKIAEQISKLLPSHGPSDVTVTLGVFMAAHILGTPRSIARVSAESGVDRRSLTSVYEQIYPDIRRIVSPEAFEIIVARRRERISRVLSPLAWPEI